MSTTAAPSTADSQFRIHAGRAKTRTSLADLLGPARAEEAERLSHAWIKSLRAMHVDGRPLRDRFTYNGDSLWWFAELYLHKQRTINQAFATILALETLLEAGRPDRLVVLAASPVVRALAPRFAARHGLAYADETSQERRGWRGSVAQRITPRLYAVSPILKRWRAGQFELPGRPPAVAAFVHSAFWQEATGDDTYVGPVLQALMAHYRPDGLQLVGVGPTTNFRVRTWRRRLDDFRESDLAPASLTPIEALSPLPALAGSRRVWRERAAIRRALLESSELRAACVLRGIDAWSPLRDDLAGVAMLQFPWSARAMDEAAAALDALRPRTVVTYAEAGGWGRALTLEARRRRIPVVGIQHGFISRHWLNYLHEPDEIAASPSNPDDRGCPLADLTLLYDDFAREHLVTAGHYPAHRLQVVGNPRLDALLSAARALSKTDLDRVKKEAGLEPGQHLVLVAAKRIPEFDASFRALFDAVKQMPDVHVVVRPHPAETAEPYLRLAGHARNVKVVPLSLSAVALMLSARLVVTINSTVAIEAMALDVPSLAMRLPNYLSPFVNAGAMAGTSALEEIGPAVSRLVHDEAARRALADGRRRFMEMYRMTPDGRSAARAVEAIEKITGRG